MSHIGFSFIVVILVIIAGAKIIKLGKKDETVSAIRPYGAILHGLVIIQFVMGWGALAMTRTGDEDHPPIPNPEDLASAHPIRIGETIVTSTHHVVGALLLGTLAAALVWSLRLASKRVIR
jgi:heme A synthase